MIVNWKLQRLNVVPILSKKEGGAVSSITLLPGNNDIDEEDWEKMKAILKDHIEAGNLVPVATVTEAKGPGGRPTTKETPAVFADLNSADAIQLVNNCNNQKTLAKWLKSETRDEVRVSIKDRVEEIQTQRAAKKVAPVQE